MKIVNDECLLITDARGNIRLDTLENLLQTAAVAEVQEAMITQYARDL